MNVTLTFQARVENAAALAEKLKKLIALNHKQVLSAKTAEEKKALIAQGKKVTVNNLVRVLVARALEAQPTDVEILGLIYEDGVKTGRPARAS